jgi:hypothetical protein
MAVSKRVRRHRKLLAQLSVAKSRKQRQQLLGKCGREPIVCLIEIIKNALARSYRIPPSRLRKLRPQAAKIRRISRIESITKARKALVGGGAFLPHILIPLLASLAGRLIENAIRPAVQTRPVQQQRRRNYDDEDDQV